MDNKNLIESILKQRFFVTPTGYPPQNGFMDYGPPLAQIKLQLLSEFRRVMVDEDTYEIEPSAILPYEVLKNSGHIDKFCDVILTDGDSIFRADHYIEEKVGTVFEIPKNLKEEYATIVENVELLKKGIFLGRHRKQLLKKKVETVAEALEAIDISVEHSSEQLTQEEASTILAGFETEKRHLDDCNKLAIDFIVALYNLHSPAGKPFNPAKDFNLIFQATEKLFLRPEIAQSQFTNFSKLYALNNEKLPFSSLAIGRSYRNEISARGGMFRTKEFEQAEIEYFSESGSHSGFESVRDVTVVLYPNNADTFTTTLGKAFDSEVIKSESISYFIAKAQEFLLAVGFKLESLRYRQHKKNEMAHYAADCWDVEIKTLAGWIECAGIADRTTYDLTAHSKDINANVRKVIPPKKIYTVVLDRKSLGRELKSRFKLFEEHINGLTQEYIAGAMKNGELFEEFDGRGYTLPLKERTTDCEFFIPRVVEPSFGISRILYALVEQSFTVRDDRVVLSLRPKMCYLHCVISFMKYLGEFSPLLDELRKQLRQKSIRFRINDRTCSIGRRYSSCDELGVPFFVTFDFETLDNSTVTIRERDSTSQIRVHTVLVPGILDDLISENVTWKLLMAKYKLQE